MRWRRGYAEEIAALYRVRWQVERVFKRLQSIVGLGRLPKTEPESAKAWLYGKLLLYLVIEKDARRLDRRRPIELPPQRQRSVGKETTLRGRATGDCAVG